MSTPSVTPSPRAPGRSAPKLRDSCQACAASKVKCHKEKPKCSRCAKRGLACEYLATKRAGRTSYKKQAAAAAAKRLNAHANLDALLVAGLPPTTTTTTCSTDAWFTLDAFAAANNNHHHHHHHHHDAAAFDGSPTLFGDMGTMDQTTPSTGLNPLPSFDDYLELSLSPTTALSPSSTACSQLPDPSFFPLHNGLEGLDLRRKSSTSSSCYDPNGFVDFDNPFGNTSLPTGSGGRDAFPMLDPSLLPSHSSRRSSANTTAVGSPQLPPCRSLLSSHCGAYTSCLPRALDLLKQLAPQSCPLSSSKMSPQHESNKPSSPPPTIHSVIVHNRQTIDAVRSMLECPCAADNFLPIVLTLVVCKVFGWYAAAARVGSASSSSPSSPSSSSSSSSGSQSPLVEQPPKPPQHRLAHEQVVVVGNYYCLDGQDSPYMAGQLVLSELHRVQRIVNQLSMRLTAQPSSSSSSSSPFSTHSTAYGSSRSSSSSEAFPLSLFSAPLLHQFERDLRKGLKKLSLDIVRELELVD